MVVSPDAAEGIPAQAAETGRDSRNAIDLRSPAHADKAHSFDLVIDLTTPCQKSEPRKSERLIAKAKLGRDSSRAHVLDKESANHSAQQPSNRKAVSLSDRTGSNRRSNETVDIASADPDDKPHNLKRFVVGAACLPAMPYRTSVGDSGPIMTNMTTHTSHLVASLPHAYSVALNPLPRGDYPARTFYNHIYQPNYPAFGLHTTTSGISPSAPFYRQSSSRDGYLSVANVTKGKETITAEDDITESSTFY
jgi:hypothetical protein